VTVDLVGSESGRITKVNVYCVVLAFIVATRGDRDIADSVLLVLETAHSAVHAVVGKDTVPDKVSTLVGRKLVTSAFVDSSTWAEPLGTTVTSTNAIREVVGVDTITLTRMVLPTAVSDEVNTVTAEAVWSKVASQRLSPSGSSLTQNQWYDKLDVLRTATSLFLLLDASSRSDPPAVTDCLLPKAIDAVTPAESISRVRLLATVSLVSFLLTCKDNRYDPVGNPKLGIENMV
jgi:hypothetical protein